MVAILLRPAPGEVGEDLLARGVATLDQDEADLVALLRRHLAIAAQRRRDVEAALDELLHDRQRLVASAGAQLGGGQRVTVVRRRVGGVADQAQHASARVAVLALAAAWPPARGGRRRPRRDRSRARAAAARRPAWPSPMRASASASTALASFFPAAPPSVSVRMRGRSSRASSAARSASRTASSARASACGPSGRAPSALAAASARIRSCVAASTPASASAAARRRDLRQPLDRQQRPLRLGAERELLEARRPARSASRGWPSCTAPGAPARRAPARPAPAAPPRRARPPCRAP